MISQLELKNKKLQTLVEISDADKADNPFYLELEAGYKNGPSLPTSVKATHSILHYLVRENKSSFVFSTQRIREVYENDPNWSEERHFSYKELRDTSIALERFGVKKIVSSKKNIPAVLIVNRSSPIFPHISENNDEDILSSFKEAEVTENRFVDEETKEKFRKYLN